jgi:hypothetical protein
VVSGILYHLIVEVELEGCKKLYEAKVLEKAWANFKSLESFIPHHHQGMFQFLRFWDCHSIDNTLHQYKFLFFHFVEFLQEAKILHDEYRRWHLLINFLSIINMLICRYSIFFSVADCNLGQQHINKHESPCR